MFRALLISIHSECSQLASSATSTPCWVSISIWKPLYCQARYFFKKLNQLRTSVLNKGLKQRGKNYLVRNGGKNTSFSVALELDKNWLFLCPPEITSTEKLVFEKMPGKTQKKKIKSFSFEKSFESGNWAVWFLSSRQVVWEIFCSKSGKLYCYQSISGLSGSC